MTLSFLGRVAQGYGMPVGCVLSALTDVGGWQDVAGVVRADGEVFLNAAARERAAALCRVRERDLARALPAWEREEPQGRAGGPAARLRVGAEAVAAWGPACPGCVAARCGRQVPARIYLRAHERVCARHGAWLLAVPGSEGRVVGVRGCPEVVRAQADHRRLLRSSTVGSAAFEVADAVVAEWWEEGWEEERAWPARLEATAPADVAASVWRVWGRPLVTYPETVAVARVLASSMVRQRIVQEARGLPAFRLGEAAGLVGELAGRLGRPWLADRLAARTHGPLSTWAHLCTTGGEDTAGGRLWQVRAGHRPRMPGEAAADRQPAAGAGSEGVAVPLPGVGRRGRGLHRADDAFRAGLVHARTYAAVHGHLATRNDTVQDGFALGRWMTNQRSQSLGMAAWRSAALCALDGWWSAPWPTLWQRVYHQAARHTRDRGPLDVRDGFAGVDAEVGNWLLRQCRTYGRLHPEQQRLLALLGIDGAAAGAVPPRRSQRDAMEEGLAHARTWVAEHGALAGVTADTVHDGYRLGRWLAWQRLRMGRHTLPAEFASALAQIDPGWRPPWPVAWQRCYDHARRQLQPAGADGTAEGRRVVRVDAAARRWLLAQQARYHRLRPGQQDALAALGLDTTGSESGGGQAELWLPAVRQPRLGQRADQRARFETALAHARSWADTHGHLAVPVTARHDGFALGAWLVSQRSLAGTRARQGKTPSPHLKELAAIDPWWNPPWDLQWQRSYHRAHAQARAHDPVPAARRWLREQRRSWPLLHPGQQRLLTTAGLIRP
ncbi:helicase associated domain-containing protein [Streptomyces flaveolus]|uniref:helicase associated domain-containing protein n=1 Tax=Streptomyces flaveolus TaxID=67297 RepID=UPI0033CFFA54